MAPKFPDIEVELVGKSANGFVIVGTVRQALRRAEVPDHLVESFTAEATSGDYQHLLATVVDWVSVK